MSSFFISEFYPYFFELLFILFILLLLFNLRQIICYIRKISSKTYMYLLMIVLLRLILQFTLASWHEITKYDPWEYVSAASSIFLHNDFSYCVLGNAGQCLTSILPHKAIGYPFIVSVSYFFLGISKFSATLISFASSILSIFLCFLTSYSLTKNTKSSLIAAFIFSVIPINVILSSTAMSDPTAVFFVLVTIFCFLLYYDDSASKSLMLPVLALVVTIQIRFEYLLLLPLTILLGLLYANKRALLAIISSSVLLVPYFGSIFSTSKLIKFSANRLLTPYLFNYGGHGVFNISLSVLLFFGLVTLIIKKNYKTLTFLAGWILIFMIFYSSYEHSYDIRFLNHVLLPLVIVMGIGLDFISRIIEKHFFNFKHATLLIMLFLMYFMLLEFNTSPLLQYYYPEDKFIDKVNDLGGLNIVSPMPILFSYNPNNNVASCDYKWFVQMMHNSGKRVFYYEAITLQCPSISEEYKLVEAASSVKKSEILWQVLPPQKELNNTKIN